MDSKDLIIIAGPSGVGKSATIKEFQQYYGAEEPNNDVTRGERRDDPSNYRYITRGEFFRRKIQGAYFSYHIARTFKQFGNGKRICTGFDGYGYKDLERGLTIIQGTKNSIPQVYDYVERNKDEIAINLCIVFLSLSEEERLGRLTNGRGENQSFIEGRKDGDTILASIGTDREFIEQYNIQIVDASGSVADVAAAIARILNIQKTSTQLA